MSRSSKTPSLKVNLVLSTAYQVLLVILPLITAPYVSRVIGAQGIGIYSYTSSYQTYFSMFAALGTASYGQREISRARNDMAGRSKLFWEIELMTVITSSVCIIVWLVLIALGILSAGYRVYYLVLTLGIFSTMFDISWFFAGLEQFKYTVGKNAAFKLAGVVLMFIFVRNSGDLLKYIFIMTASTMLGNLSMWIYIPRFTQKVDLHSFRLRKHFRETFVYFIPTIATSVYTVLDKTLIGLITHNEEENGYYEQATKIINMMKALTFTSLNTVLGSRISYLFAERRYDEIKQRIRMSINYILFIGLGICFGLIGVSGRFVPVYFGPGYGRVVEMLCLMSPLVVIIGISNCLGSQYFTPAGLRSLSAKFIVAGSCINLCLNLLLIPRFWGNGAIVASVIAETTITVLYMRFSNGYLTFKMLVQDGWKKLVSAAIMLFVIRLIDMGIRSNILALLLEVAGGGLLYLALLYALDDSFMRGFIVERILGRFRRRS